MTSKQVAFITGAASGLGKKIGESLLKEGKIVVFSDINQAALDEVVKEYQANGFHASGAICDVTNEESMNEAIDTVMALYGRLDILINNAGIQHVAMIEDFPTDRYRFMIDMMLVGPFIATKKVMPIMKNQKFGRIINMASIQAVVGFAGKAGYNSAKHGLVGLTKVAALESADYGITVNAVCPGYVDTPLLTNQMQDLAKTRGVDEADVLEEVLWPLIPQKRLLDVQEIADYVSFLISDKAKAITGQAIIMDGGYTIQ